MADSSLERLYAHVQGLAIDRAGGAPADRELLERYLTQHDESAFAALVHRHGAMVLCTCRRLLACEQDAEDAWQATFLVLATRGRSIRQTQCLAGWLHGVACRVSRKLRARQARHRPSMPELPEVPGRDGPPDLSWREVQAVLDEELERLPEHYRGPIILCYLEGHTRDEAARRLGWSLATLRGRLERARLRLRDRLTRRGITLSASLLGAALGSPARAAEVPATLAVSVVRSAAEVGRGVPLRSVIPDRLVTLMEGVIHAMCWTRWKAAALLLMVCLAGLSAGLLAQPGPGKAPPDSRFDPFAPPRQPAPRDLEKRVADLEKQVARLTQEVESLRKLPRSAEKEEKVEERVFHLKNIQASEAARILKEIYRDIRGVVVAVNEASNSLIVRGSPQALMDVEKLLIQIDSPDLRGDERTPSLKTYTLQGVKPEEAAKAIIQLLDDREVRVAGVGEKSLLVYASPMKQKLAAELIARIEAAWKAERDSIYRPKP